MGQALKIDISGVPVFYALKLENENDKLQYIE